MIPSHWRRDAVFLGVGVLAGVTIAFSAGQSHDRLGNTVAPSHETTSVQTKASPTPASAEDLDAASIFRRRPKADAAAWKQAAAVYQSTGNLVVARSLMQQLPPSGLRKLALALASQSNSPRIKHALHDIFERWGEVDPFHALAQAQAFPPPLADAVTYAAMEGFAAGAPEQAAAYFSAPPAAEDRGTLRSAPCRGLTRYRALQAWSAQDPAAAANFLVDPSVKYTSPHGPGDIAENWAQLDPAAALDWASRLSDPAQKTAALTGVLTGWAQTDPQAAANYMLGTATDSNRGDLVDALVRNWSEQNPTDAARWTLAQTGDVQAQAIGSLMLKWSIDDPAAAATWAAQLPDSSARSTAYSELASSWYIFDPAATQNWLGGLPAGDARDAAITGYASSERNGDILDAADVLSRVQTIGDSVKRDDTLVSVLNRWLTKNPQAAQRWIAQAGLPASVTGKLKGG